jgi:hypothetical protein
LPKKDYDELADAFNQIATDLKKVQLKIELFKITFEKLLNPKIF